MLGVLLLEGALFSYLGTIVMSFSDLREPLTSINDSEVASEL